MPVSESTSTEVDMNAATAKLYWRSTWAWEEHKRALAAGDAGAVAREQTVRAQIARYNARAAERAERARARRAAAEARWVAEHGEPNPDAEDLW